MTNYDAFAHTFSNSRKDMHWPEVDVILSDIEKKWYTSLLDIGCGNGRFLKELRNKNIQPIKYLWVDNSAWMIKEAEILQPNESFFVSSMPDLKEIPNEKTFDAIVLLASFHHLESANSRKNCLLRLKDLLAPHGSIYMTNWNLLDQVKYQKSHRGNGDFDIKIGEFSRYYHGFTLEELRELFVETGWNIVENRIFDWERNIFSILQL
jgi:tRNA (uracil-5-)-methyltransferase TRM9